MSRLSDCNELSIIAINTIGYRWILKALSDEMTDEELDDIIAEIDTDGSGTVDYNGTSATP